MKQSSTNNISNIPKKLIRSVLFLLIILVGFPFLGSFEAEAQTKRTGNFFTRRFKRKQTFQKKSKTNNLFQRKPFKCSDVGKRKIEEVKVSKKQLKRWEEERVVKAEQEKLKGEKNEKSQEQGEQLVLSVSTRNSLEEVVSEKVNNKEESPEQKRGWYSSEIPDAPKISPIVLNKKNEISDKKNKENLGVAAKYSRLGYKIHLEGSKEQLEVIKKYLIGSGVETDRLKVTFLDESKNEGVKIELVP